MDFLQHIKAVHAALRLANVVGPEVAVARASWHICMANGIVAHSWGMGRDEQNEIFALILRGTRVRLLALAESSGTREQYNGLWTLWLHWRLPSRAPEVVGMANTSVYG